MGRKDKSEQVEGVDTITGTPLQQQAMHNCCKSVCRCRRTDRRWIYWKTLFMFTEELERVEEEEDNRKRGSWRKQTERETKHELIRKYLHLFDNMNTNKYTKMCKYRNTQTLETDWHNRSAPGLQGELCPTCSTWWGYLLICSCFIDLKVFFCVFASSVTVETRDQQTERDRMSVKLLPAALFFLIYK